MSMMNELLICHCTFLQFMNQQETHLEWVKTKRAHRFVELLIVTRPVKTLGSSMLDPKTTVRAMRKRPAHGPG